MSKRKRASGLVRGLVLQALREAMAARGPLCFASKRDAAREFADLLGRSETTIMRALAHPENADLAAAISAAIQPRASFRDGAHQGAAAAGIGGGPVGGPGSGPVVGQGEPAPMAPPSPPASPQADAGGPAGGPVSVPRERVPPSSTNDPGPTPDSSPLAPLPTSLGRRPARVTSSRFEGECFLCCCWLDRGQALILVPFSKRSGARIFCIDHAAAGLELAQLEWDLAFPARTPTLFSPHTHQPEE